MSREVLILCMCVSMFLSRCLCVCQCLSVSASQRVAAPNAGLASHGGQSSESLVSGKKQGAQTGGRPFGWILMSLVFLFCFFLRQSLQPKAEARD